MTSKKQRSNKNLLGLTAIIPNGQQSGLKSAQSSLLLCKCQNNNYIDFTSALMMSLAQVVLSATQTPVYNIILSFRIYLMNKGKRLTKRNRQSITIFQYYTKHLFPTLRPELNSNSCKPAQFQATYRDIVYNYVVDVARGFDKIDYKNVYSALKAMYLDHLQQRTADNRGIKLHPLHLKFTPFSSLIQDHIQILISNESTGIESPKSVDIKSSKCFGKSPMSNPFLSELNLPSKEELFLENYRQNLSFYVIHQARDKEDDSLSWLKFVEKYEFTKIKNEEGRPGQPVIVYQAAFSYSNAANKFNLDLNPRFLQNYFQQSCPVVYKKSILLKSLVQEMKKGLRKKIESVEKLISSASFDNVHRRYLRLKKECRPIFEQLKQKSIAYLNEINGYNKQNPYFIQNTVCRMMENNSFSLEASWKALTYYFDKEKRLRDRYTWQSFEEYHKMNIFVYLGKDYMGRPVILNRMRNCLMSKITDKQLFFDYHFYLFQIFLQDRMEGWVDQFDAIGDGDEQVNDNTDIIFTKDVLTEIFKLTLGRPHHLIGFNIGVLGKVIFKIFYPLLPERILKHAIVFGSDQQPEVIEKLREIMPNETIPDFLGGDNHKTLYQGQDTVIQGQKNLQVSFQHSLVTDQKRK